MEQITVHLVGDDAALLEELAITERVSEREMVARALSHYMVSPPNQTGTPVFTIMEAVAIAVVTFFLGVMV